LGNHSRGAYRRLVAGLIALALLSACSTTRPVIITDPQSLADQITAGDRIEIEKKNGAVLKFTVTEVSPAGLQGGTVFVPGEDIARVSVMEGVHPAMVVFLVLLAGTAVWMLVDSDDVCGDWPAVPCEEGL
jgi:hypothetical protein